MIKYEIKVGSSTIYVSLAAKSSNERAMLVYEGNDISGFKLFLESSYGAFGHIIGQATTPIDLHYAMSNQKQFDARLIEGEITSYDPEIPDDAVT
ncbi:MAG: hypothetical protein KME54_17570 [Tolypothrix brevis GSE-NOS-MK-07-07A]|nr:hypothetical protein [Tolypothrix brevis GSE-NOS-MK-07-07A]